MNRRELVTIGASVVGVAALAGCGVVPVGLPGRGIPRIGFLSPGPRESRADQVDAFLQGLHDLGYIEGQTITIEWRFTPEGSTAEFSQLAKDLVGQAVDLIVVASSTPAVQAAKQATSTIPLLAVNVVNPLQTGLAASLTQSGVANLTALSGDTPGLSAKKLELLRDLAPTTRLVAVLSEAGSQSSQANWSVVQQAAIASGIPVQQINMQIAEDLDHAFEIAAASHVDAMFNDASALLLRVRAQFAELALRYGLPSTANMPFVEAGCLLYYGPNLLTVFRRAGVYVDKILKGTKAGDLPIEQPTSFDLAVNVTTLQSLGLTVPASVLPLVTAWVQ